MKNLQEYITESKQTSGYGCVEMVKSILYQLSQEHSNCKYDSTEEKWTGKDAGLWNAAGQFLYDYCQELTQKDFKKIVDEMGWKKYIPDVNDINPAEISMCMALELMK